MPDRIEREIEDILKKLDDLPDKGQKPIPFRQRPKPRASSKAQGWFGKSLARLSLNQIMLYALIAVLVAFFLRSLPFASWVMIGALVVLATAFVMSMRNGGRSSSTGGGGTEKRWRGEVIDLSPPPGPGIAGRIKGLFGKGRR